MENLPPESFFILIVGLTLGAIALLTLYARSHPKIVAVPVNDLDPGAVLLAWRADDHDPVVQTFVRAAREGIAASR